MVAVACSHGCSGMQLWCLNHMQKQAWASTQKLCKEFMEADLYY